MVAMKKAAVVLTGSGFKDGSEIREAVGVLWALSERGVAAECFAPDEPQADVVNCLTGEPMAGETRNQLVEAARIARGEVLPLSRLKAADFDFLVLPGGYGAAKNLCSFAREGAAGKAHPEVARVIRDFHALGKPIGAVCIAPAVVALVLPELEITLGPAGGAGAEIEKLGHRHISKGPAEWHVDARHRLVTTPAYMHDHAPLHEIFAGIRGMVGELCRLA